MALRATARLSRSFPPRPQLTLFTGGPECSLCEVAKDALQDLRTYEDFDLTYFNIREPPPGADEHEAKKWRRLYQYDIPVLHLGDKRIQKHRINPEGVIKALEAWRAEHGKSQDEEV